MPHLNLRFEFIVLFAKGILLSSDVRFFVLARVRSMRKDEQENDLRIL